MRFPTFNDQTAPEAEDFAAIAAQLAACAVRQEILFDGASALAAQANLSEAQVEALLA